MMMTTIMNRKKILVTITEMMMINKKIFVKRIGTLINAKGGSCDDDHNNNHTTMMGMLMSRMNIFVMLMNKKKIFV